MTGKRLTIFLFFALLVALQGCAQTSDSNSNLAKNSNINSNVNVANIAVNNNNVSNTANVIQNVNSLPNANKKSPQVAVPPPKIGSGAGDMVVFTQIRSKLAEDRDLLNNVIVDLKEGNAVLTGKVVNIEQKQKAEQLIKSVAGVKSIKNNLTVAP